MPRSWSWLLVVPVLMVANTAQSQGFEDRTWVAERIQGSMVSADIKSTFALAAGKVTGSGGCNRLMGSATITGDSIDFGGIATTRMACPAPVMAQERAFIEALASARSFRIEAGFLFLRDAAGAEVARLREQG
jgi:heat shock protein HslJ